MKLHYKHESEANLGEGIMYIEFIDGIASRQVEIYGNKWFCSNKKYHPEIGLALCDRPLSELNILSDCLISENEFEAAWNEAIKKNVES
jgi:hypothetical protein